MQRSLHRQVEKIHPEWLRYYSIHIVKGLQSIIATDGESGGSIESGPELLITHMTEQISLGPQQLWSRRMVSL